MRQIILWLATFGPIGRKLPAPGTFGTLIGILLYGSLIFFCGFHPWIVAAWFVPLYILGIPLCTAAEVILEETDPSEIIWDEFSVVPFVFLLVPQELKESNLTELIIWLTLGCMLFRFFDIYKPLGIKYLQNLPRGLGVMSDDLAAAIFSAILLFFAKTFPLSFS